MLFLDFLPLLLLQFLLLLVVFLLELLKLLPVFLIELLLALLLALLVSLLLSHSLPFLLLLLLDSLALLVLFLAKILSTYVDFQRLGVVFIPPLQMKLPKSSGREPDVAFVAQAHLDRVTQTHLDGPADLVVEVISPDSIKRDRETKFGEYQQGGIPEYWILDPDKEQVDFYRLDAQGVYQRVAPDAQGIYRSHAVPGFWLQVAWLWQFPLPDAEDVLLDVIGKPYADYRRERMKQRGL